MYSFRPVLDTRPCAQNLEGPGSSESVEASSVNTMQLADLLAHIIDMN